MFVKLQAQYMKIPSSNLGRTCCVQKLFLTFRKFFVHNMFSPCSAKRKASDKDLPVLSNFKTKRKTFQIFVAFSENLDFKFNYHFIKISIVGVMVFFLYKNRCYFVWKKKCKCKRHYCQLLLFRTLVIVAFDMCEKSFTSACIPWVFLLLPHRYTHNTV